MRRLKLQLQITIDGYMGGPNGELDWMVWDWDDELNQFVGKLTDAVDTILLGRNMAEGFVSHWKSVADNPEDPSYQFGKKMYDTPKVVFSRTLEESPWENTVVANGKLANVVQKLKNMDGGDMIVYGGSEFVSDLVDKNLIDDYYLFINPAALGDEDGGMRVFNEGTVFRLIESRAFSCGIVLLHYQTT